MTKSNYNYNYQTPAQPLHSIFTVYRCTIEKIKGKSTILAELKLDA